ncbi:MAG: glycoside hydrolase family 97 N-terminal domain-containing protein [Cellulosilyticaceae bacterium]
MQEIKIVSPNGNIACCLQVGGQKEKGRLFYEVYYLGKSIIAPSQLSFELEGETNLECGWHLQKYETEYVDQEWENPWGENRYVRDHYHGSEVKLIDHLSRELTIELRVYDEGVALRYRIHEGEHFKQIQIRNEYTEFRLQENHYAFTTHWAQGAYQKCKLSEIGTGAERPLVIEIEENKCYIALAEANLVDYARMKLDYKEQHTLVSSLSGKPLYCFKEEEGLRESDETQLIKYQGDLPLVTPWRVVMIGESASALYENKTLIINLNEPCEIPDTSFITPGKVIRVMPLTTEVGKSCVDFAVRRQLQYIEVDAGWYGDENSFASNATSVSVDPNRYAGEFDLFEIIAYAKRHGIKVILYINQRAMMNQLDELLPLYKSWGIAGIKYGFVEVGPQRWTAWLHECVRKAAAYGMVLTIHDEYRPTGYSRTYPNLLTQEGIRGDEERQLACNTLTIIFTRMLCGAGDHTVCYYDERVDDYWSHAYQLAKALIIFSPLQFLYWYDNPAQMDEGEELTFFDELATVWDETKILNGEIGKYVAMARRKEDQWFVGIMNATEKRTFTVALDFLAPGKSYQAWIHTDDVNLKTRTKVRTQVIEVSSEISLTYEVEEDNGVAIRFKVME